MVQDAVLRNNAYKKFKWEKQTGSYVPSHLSSGKCIAACVCDPADHVLH
jgi:hypothetical protein